MKSFASLVGFGLCLATAAAGAAGASGAAGAAAPDPSETGHDFFDLRCVSTRAGSPDRLLHVEIASDGQFDIVPGAGGASMLHDVRTYTNAITWREGDELRSLDRMTGEIRARAHGTLYRCERIGGRKF